jgi:hypothetical protein
MVYNINEDIIENKPIINKDPEAIFDILPLKPSFTFILVYNKYICNSIIIVVILLNV